MWGDIRPVAGMSLELRRGSGLGNQGSPRQSSPAPALDEGDRESVPWGAAGGLIQLLSPCSPKGPELLGTQKGRVARGGARCPQG